MSAPTDPIREPASQPRPPQTIEQLVMERLGRETVGPVDLCPFIGSLHPSFIVHHEDARWFRFSDGSGALLPPGFYVVPIAPNCELPAGVTIVRPSDDAWLGKKLEELRQKYARHGDVIAAWEAIERIAKRNSEWPDAPYAMPAWLNEYLRRAADKISRLHLGIRPDDDRPSDEIGFIGELRKVPQSDGAKAMKPTRCRDERARYVGDALGFVGKGWNAFARHDRVEADESLLRVYDADFGDNKAYRDETRELLFSVLNKQAAENEQKSVSPEGFKNRVSKARTARQSAKPIIEPTSRHDD